MGGLSLQFRRTESVQLCLCSACKTPASKLNDCAKARLLFVSREIPHTRTTRLIRICHYVYHCQHLCAFAIPRKDAATIVCHFENMRGRYETISLRAYFHMRIAKACTVYKFKKMTVQFGCVLIIFHIYGVEKHFRIPIEMCASKNLH